MNNESMGHAAEDMFSRLFFGLSYPLHIFQYMHHIKMTNFFSSWDTCRRHHMQIPFSHRAVDLYADFQRHNIE